MQNQNTRPNDAEVLSEVLTCLAHMLYHGQITKGSRALINILNAVDDYDSGDIISLRDMIFYNFEGQPQPYEPVLEGQLEECRISLWEAEPELDTEYSLATHALQGTPPDFEAPFADPNSPWNRPSPPSEPDSDPVDEFYLHRSQVDLIREAINAYTNSKQGNLSYDEGRRLDDLLECLA